MTSKIQISLFPKTRFPQPTVKYTRELVICFCLLGDFALPSMIIPTAILSVDPMTLKPHNIHVLTSCS